MNTRTVCSDHLFGSAEVVHLSDNRIVQVDYEQIPLEISHEEAESYPSRGSVDISRAVYLIRCLLALTANIHVSLTLMSVCQGTGDYLWYY